MITLTSANGEVRIYGFLWLYHSRGGIFNLLKPMKINKLLYSGYFLAGMMLLPPSLTVAQPHQSGYCETESSWEQIRINTDKIPSGPARIFVISNRPYLPAAEDHEYFPNDIAAFRKVSYFIATCDGKEWRFTFVPDFNAGMKEIDDGRNILLFIEGHGKSLPMALNRAFQVQARYDVALVVFDWPSKNRNFNQSLARVRRCGDNFFNLLLQIRDYRSQFMSAQQHFSILAHSLGNYFLSNFVVCGDWQYLKDKFVDNVILNASAIRSKEHGVVLSKLEFSERLYITSNKNDFVLRGAHLLTSGKMLGNLAIKPLVPQAQYLNFTSVVGREHSYYFGYHAVESDNPAFFYFYNTAIQGDEVNLKNQQYFIPRETGDGFDIKPLQAGD